MQLQYVSLGFLKLTFIVTITLFDILKQQLIWNQITWNPSRQSAGQSANRAVSQSSTYDPSGCKGNRPRTFFNLVQRSLVLTERIAASGNEIAAKETKSTLTSGLREPRYCGHYFHWSLKTHVLLFLRLRTFFGSSLANYISRAKRLGGRTQLSSKWPGFDGTQCPCVCCVFHLVLFLRLQYIVF